MFYDLGLMNVFPQDFQDINDSTLKNNVLGINVAWFLPARNNSVRKEVFDKNGALQFAECSVFYFLKNKIPSLFLLTTNTFSPATMMD